MQVQRIGEVEITRIVEIEQMALDTLWLFPKAAPELIAANLDWLGPRLIDPDGAKLYLSFHSFLVRTPHHTILVDTCNGNHKQRPSMPAWSNLELPYLQNLARAGVAPEDVDIVLCTHLHADHVGWNTRLLDGRWVPTFPNARYLMSRPEYEHWNRLHRAGPEQPVNRGSFADSVLPVMAHGQAELVEMDHVLDQEIGECLRLEGAPGHSPGHVLLHVGQGHDRAVLCGDVIHHPLQLAEPALCCGVDFDPAGSIRSRRALLECVADTSTTLLTAHFPAPTAGHVVRHGDAFRFRFA